MIGANHGEKRFETGSVPRGCEGLEGDSWLRPQSEKHSAWRASAPYTSGSKDDSTPLVSISRFYRNGSINVSADVRGYVLTDVTAGVLGEVLATCARPDRGFPGDD